MSYNRQDGLGTSVGISSNNNKITHGMGLNITRSEYGGWGADVSTDNYGPGNLSGGLAYTQRDGFTVSLNVNGTNAFNYNSQSGLSGNTDFMSQYAMNNGLAQGVAEESDTSEPNSAQQHNNAEQGAQAIEGAGFATSGRRNEGEGHVIGFSDDGPEPAHGAPGVHDSGHTVTLSGSVEGNGGRQLSASDVAEFKADWKKESPAQTDASLAALKKAGYDTSGLEKFVQDYRNGKAANNQSSTPATTTTQTTHQNQPGVFQNILNSVTSGASNLWNRITGGSSSHVISTGPEHYDTVTGNKLTYKLHEEGPGFKSNSGQDGADDHRYGQKPLVDTISNTINEWTGKNPGYPIVTNDLGYKTGGYDPRATGTQEAKDAGYYQHHKNGNAIDLSYMSTPGVDPTGKNYDVNKAYDRDKTIEYIKTISRNIPQGVGSKATNFIKFNDPAVHEYFKDNPLLNLHLKKDDKGSMHSNHLHLQLGLPKVK